jgi:hypothetical protein
MTTSRTTTGIPSKASPGSATRTVAAMPRESGTEHMAAPKPAHTVSHTVRAAPSRPAHHTVSHTTTTAAPSPPKPAATHATLSEAVHAKPSKPAHHESETASKTTTDHDAIRKWAEKRGGHPTSVTGTEHGKESAGVLRLDFGVKDEKLHAVDWDLFFQKFEEAKLAFLYQDKTSNGKMSRFHKFIHRH